MEGGEDLDGVFNGHHGFSLRNSRKWAMFGFYVMSFEDPMTSSFLSLR